MSTYLDKYQTVVFPPSERSEWQRYCFHRSVCLCVCTVNWSIRQMGRWMIVAVSWLMLWTSNLIHLIPGSVWTWPLVIYGKETWLGSRDLRNFGALNAHSYKTPSLPIISPYLPLCPLTFPLFLSSLPCPAIPFPPTSLFLSSPVPSLPFHSVHDYLWPSLPVTSPFHHILQSVFGLISLTRREEPCT